MENHKCINENRFNKTDLEINTLNINMKNMEKKIDKILKTLETLDEKLDERYAGKWTEKPLIWGAYLI
jgi:peptidoglycan hydrolase CwlO-like protein